MIETYGKKVLFRFIQTSLYIYLLSKRFVSGGKKNSSGVEDEISQLGLFAERME